MQDTEVEVILSRQNSVSKNIIQLIPSKLYINNYQAQFKILIISNIIELLTIIYIGFFQFDVNYIWMIDFSHDRFKFKAFCISSIIHSILLCLLLFLWTKYALSNNVSYGLTIKATSMIYMINFLLLMIYSMEHILKSAFLGYFMISISIPMISIFIKFLPRINKPWLI